MEIVEDCLGGDILYQIQGVNSHNPLDYFCQTHVIRACADNHYHFINIRKPLKYTKNVADKDVKVSISRYSHGEFAIMAYRVRGFYIEKIKLTSVLTGKEISAPLERHNSSSSCYIAIFNSLDEGDYFISAE